MCPPRIQLEAGELESQLRAQGFSRTAFLPSTDLPPSVGRQPQIAALGAGTFMMTALSCHREEADDLSEPGDPHALIAPFARRNYYAEAVARLKGVVRALRASHGLGRQAMRVFCNSPLPEKALAVLSGLGSRGKNTLILAPGMGSLFIIAGVFLPATVVGAAEMRSAAAAPFPLCGECRTCQDACPVGALEEAGRLDESRCLQALCTEPHEFSEASRRAWGFRFYGCQSCQDVCPHNREVEEGAEVRRGELGPSLSLKRVLSLSPPRLKEFLRPSALARSWIPPRTLLRNALIAAGNRRDPVLREPVARHHSNPDPLLARAAAWARGLLDRND
jgi:epoxyqueuosine reductase